MNNSSKISNKNNKLNEWKIWLLLIPGLLDWFPIHTLETPLYLFLRTVCRLVIRPKNKPTIKMIPIKVNKIMAK
jgi:hypothetical protein